MANSAHPSVRFRNRNLVRAEEALEVARRKLAQTTLKTILGCKHEEVANLHDYGAADGRVCLQCGLFEERYAGYRILNDDLVYALENFEPSEVVTVRILAEDYASLYRLDGNEVTLEQLLRSKLSLPEAK
jgi:hypothetical protein